MFRSPKDPARPVEYTLIRKTFERVVKRAGVPDCTLHTVRHWFSTLTANTVSNPRVGMALTGHKSHSAYMAYIHKDKEQVRALADQLGQFAASHSASNNVTPLRAAKQ